MEAYVSGDDFKNAFPNDSLSGTELTAALESASRDINGMTFGRIARCGFAALTAFQQSMVKLAVCEQAHFCTSYGEFLNSPLASYGINGVSMAFKEDAVKMYSGIQTTEKVHSLLIQSGLAWPGM